MDASQEQKIRSALAGYLRRSDSDAPYRDLARRYAVLPILPDWSGFVGLREDGAIFWVSDEDGAISADVNDHALHLALIRGPELFPELGFLTPIPDSDWVTCWSCGGSGALTVDGARVEGVRCTCGGLGKLPQALARSLGQSGP